MQKRVRMCTVAEGNTDKHIPELIDVLEEQELSSSGKESLMRAP